MKFGCSNALYLLPFNHPGPEGDLALNHADGEHIVQVTRRRRACVEVFEAGRRPSLLPRSVAAAWPP